MRPTGQLGAVKGPIHLLGAQASLGRARKPTSPQSNNQHPASPQYTAGRLLTGNLLASYFLIGNRPTKVYYRLN